MQKDIFEVFRSNILRFKQSILIANTNASGLKTLNKYKYSKIVFILMYFDTKPG